MLVSNFRRRNTCCTHVIEIKDSFSNDSQRDSQHNKNSYSFFSVSSLTKVSAFITILSGIFGLCYQKGLIFAMQFGNMQGSYDVKEILYSSLQAYYSFFENISDISAYSLWDKDLYFFTSVSVFCCIALYFIFVNKNGIRKFLESAKERLGNHQYNNSIVNYFSVTVVGLVFGIFIKFVQTISIFLFIAIIAFLLLPSALSFELGRIDAKKAMEKDPCLKLTADQFQVLDKESYVRQCTHVVINNKLLRGTVMLGTKDGYYLRINGAFVYISHDGKSCIYSKDMKASEMKSHNTTFPKIESLQKFCYTEEDKGT